MGPLGVEWCEGDFWVIDTAYFVTANTPALDLKFLYYLIKYIGLNHLKDGTSNPSLSRDTFYAQGLPYPPLAQQRAIAQVLTSLDDKIDLNRRMNQTLEAMARALFKAWFVDFEGLQSVASPAKADGWREGSVLDLASIRRHAIDPGTSPDQVFDHFSIPAFDEGRLPRAETGSQIKSAKLAVSPGSVLISRINPHIPRVWLPKVSPSRPAVCSTEFIVLMPREDSSREYLYALLSSRGFAETFVSLVGGTTGSHQRVRPEDLGRMVVAIPPAATIEQFSAITRPLLDRAEHNLDESQMLAAIRDALLPKLLSGEIRVREAEKLVEAAT